MKHFCCFSEAIREGAKLRPQGFVVLYCGERSCAIGAGLEAILGSTENVTTGYDAFGFFPYLQTRIDGCPECGARAPFGPGTLLALIAHLNDSHRWTREAIADWLQEEENKLGFETVVESESQSPELVTV